MRLSNFLGAIALSTSTFVVGAASAATYDISWIGDDDYTMTGQLIFDDALLGSGIIDETQITDLTIDVMYMGASVGTRSYLTDGAGIYDSTFNLNFDTITGEFLTGGLSDSSTGQLWFTGPGGSTCETFGFASGASSQAVCVDGDFVASSNTLLRDSILTTTFVAAVPLPAGGLLLLSALGGAAGLRRKRKA